MGRFKNFAGSTLAAGISSVATTFSCAAGDGARFPTGEQYVTVWDKQYASASLDPNRERILVSGRSGDVFTVATNGRGQSGTSAVAHNTNGRTYGIVGVVGEEDLNDGELECKFKPTAAQMVATKSRSYEYLVWLGTIPDGYGRAYRYDPTSSAVAEVGTVLMPDDGGLPGSGLGRFLLYQM